MLFHFLLELPSTLRKEQHEATLQLILSTSSAVFDTDGGRMTRHVVGRWHLFCVSVTLMCFVYSWLEPAQKEAQCLDDSYLRDNIF